MLKKTIFISLGLLIILIGIAGLFLPFIQGLLLIFLGLLVLGKGIKISFVERFREKLHHHYKKYKP